MAHKRYWNTQVSRSFGRHYGRSAYLTFDPPPPPQPSLLLTKSRFDAQSLSRLPNESTIYVGLEMMKQNAMNRRQSNLL